MPGTSFPLQSSPAGSRSLHLHTQLLRSFWAFSPQPHLEGARETFSAQANSKLWDLPTQLHFPHASETVPELPVFHVGPARARQTEKLSLTILTISGNKRYLRPIKIDGTGPLLYKMQTLYEKNSLCCLFFHFSAGWFEKQGQITGSSRLGLSMPSFDTQES